MISRRVLLAGLGAAPAAAGQSVNLGFGIAAERPLADPFAGKRAMIVQRSLPPLLETPMDAFKTGTITPTDRFFVRWHNQFPTEIDPADHSIRITGHVATPQSLSLASLARLPQAEVTAVNQCAGNGRGLFSPRVPGAQWANGAIGCAVWRGPRLRDVLALASPRPGALVVRASGLDVPPMEGAPQFAKSISLDHALGGEVLLATHMNGAPLPLVHGFPVRLIVPGWFSTYWVKMLDHLEVLNTPDTGHWTMNAYRAPDNPQANADPAAPAGPSRPVTAMVPRSFITNIAPGSRHPKARPLEISGIAMGGDTGVESVVVSADNGQSWHKARLGPDQGRYSFRRFATTLMPPAGATMLLARATNSRGEAQPLTANWNPGGYYRSVVEPVAVEFI